MSNGGTANQNYHSVFFLAQGGDVAGTENQITSGSGRAYTSAYYGTAHDSTGNLTLAVTAQLSHSEANFYISKRNNTAMVWRGSS
jgi:cyclophilin family peptidyl-prolyl cis-trans isomerase